MSAFWWPPLDPDRSVLRHCEANNGGKRIGKITLENAFAKSNGIAKATPEPGYPFLGLSDAAFECRETVRPFPRWNRSRPSLCEAENTQSVTSDVGFDKV